MRILGVNETGHESGNAGVTDGRDLPWLQDTAEVDAWSLWGVAYRDVIVIDPDHSVVGVYNLTDHDLADPDHVEELRSLLLE